MRSLIESAASNNSWRIFPSSRMSIKASMAVISSLFSTVSRITLESIAPSPRLTGKPVQRYYPQPQYCFTNKERCAEFPRRDCPREDSGMHYTEERYCVEGRL